MNTGLTVWDAGVLLARCFADAVFRDEVCFAKKSGDASCVCLELGAGTGLAGIALACCTKAIDHLILTDLRHICLLTEANVQYNKSKFKVAEDRVHVRELQWTDRRAAAQLREEFGNPGLIFGSDLIYWAPSSNQVAALVQVLEQLLCQGS